MLIVNNEHQHIKTNSTYQLSTLNIVAALLLF